MENPLDIIEKTKATLKEIIEENNITYLSNDMTYLLRLYSADLCNILLKYFPDAIIMINKSYNNCALMIQGEIYDSSGISDKKQDFIVAQAQDILFIKKSFFQLSEDLLNELAKRVYDKNENFKNTYVLRKNSVSMV